jgi:hypothetical protein
MEENLSGSSANSWTTQVPSGLPQSSLGAEANLTSFRQMKLPGVVSMPPNWNNPVEDLRPSNLEYWVPPQTLEMVREHQLLRQSPSRGFDTMNTLLSNPPNDSSPDNKDRTFEEVEFTTAINSRREFNWQKIRKLSGWMHTITSQTPQKDMTDDLQQRLYITTVNMMRYIQELKDSDYSQNPCAINYTSILYPQATTVSPTHPVVIATQPVRTISAQPEPSSDPQPSGKSKKNSSSKKRKNPPKINRNLYCYMCGVTETPEWRRGPSGEHTLCNACGLQYAKSIRNLKNQQNGQVQPKRRKAKKIASSGSSDPSNPSSLDSTLSDQPLNSSENHNSSSPTKNRTTSS